MAQKLIDDLNSTMLDELLGKFGDEKNAEDREALKQMETKACAEKIKAMQEKYLEYR